jgi:hypothetical protein
MGMNASACNRVELCMMLMYMVLHTTLPMHRCRGDAWNATSKSTSRT